MAFDTQSLITENLQAAGILASRFLYLLRNLSICRNSRISIPAERARENASRMSSRSAILSCSSLSMSCTRE